MSKTPPLEMCLVFELPLAGIRVTRTKSLKVEKIYFLFSIKNSNHLRFTWIPRIYSDLKKCLFFHLKKEQMFNHFESNLFLWIYAKLCLDKCFWKTKNLKHLWFSLFLRPVLSLLTLANFIFIWMGLWGIISVKCSRLF